MRLRWHGQSAFTLTGAEHTVLIDPFGEFGIKGLKWEYEPVSGVAADVLLITHEHGDHNHAASAVGEPFTVRSRAGTYADSPIGEIVAVASEHDDEAGVRRGPNAIIRFELDGVRIAHFGDFGQGALRHKQAAAIGEIDLLMVPIGGGPTIDAAGAHLVMKRFDPRWTIPMHYRTHAIDWLEDETAFVAGRDDVTRWDGPEGELSGPPGIIIPAAP